MARERCPGQDTRYLKPEDVYEVACPACGAPVEFFKDDRSQKCTNCGIRFRNPDRDDGCAKWCPHSDECVDRAEDGDRHLRE